MGSTSSISQNAEGAQICRDEISDEIVKIQLSYFELALSMLDDMYLLPIPHFISHGLQNEPLLYYSM